MRALAGKQLAASDAHVHGEMGTAMQKWGALHVPSTSGGATVALLCTRRHLQDATAATADLQLLPAARRNHCEPPR